MEQEKESRQEFPSSSKLGDSNTGTGPLPDSIKLSRERVSAVVPGGVWRRFVAGIIDYSILQIIQIPVVFGINFLTQFLLKSEDFLSLQFSGKPFSLIEQAVWLLVAYLYFGWFYSRKGASPGKMLLGLKVVNYRLGSYVSWWRAGLRDTLGKLLSVITVLGLLIAVFRKDKRTLHDAIFSTQVVRSLKPPA